MMLLLVLLVMTGDGRLHTEAVTVEPPAANITLTLVNTFPCYGEAPPTHALGLEVDSYGSILGVSNTDGRAYGYLPETGAVVYHVTLDPTNTKCFDIAIDQWSPTDYTYLTNDWNQNHFFLTEDYGLSWSQIADPTGESGRGMSFDGTHYWSTLGTGSITRLTLGGSHTVYPVAETSGQLSGLAVFPHAEGTAVAVTAYGAQGIWFYQFTGSGLNYLGYGELPFPETDSLYGLVYSPLSGCIHISYKTNSGGYFISQLQFEIAQNLTPATWASIKAAL